jgi:amino acid permease
MYNKENNTINKLAKYSFNLQLFLFIGVMFIGYFSTFDQTEDIYINRADQSIFMVIGKAFFIILLLCNIGLYYYMNRNDFENLIKTENTKISKNKRLICSIVVLSTLLLISLEFDNVVLLLSFIGGTGNVYIVFIVPVLLYIRSYKPESRYMYYTFMITVTFIGASNTILSIMNYFIKVFI